MQLFRNAVFSAPTSFLALASLRHSVRLACFAAASPEGAAAGAGAGPAGDGALVEAAVTGTSANPLPTGSRLRHTAAAMAEKRMVTTPSKTRSHRPVLMEFRIAPANGLTDEARMKLA
jgi:hypothetical protein